MLAVSASSWVWCYTTTIPWSHLARSSSPSQFLPSGNDIERQHKPARTMVNNGREYEAPYYLPSERTGSFRSGRLFGGYRSTCVRGRLYTCCTLFCSRDISSKQRSSRSG